MVGGKKVYVFFNSLAAPRLQLWPQQAVSRSQVLRSDYKL